MRKKLGFLKNILIQLPEKVLGDNLLSHSAALAYFTALALAPLLILLLAFISTFSPGAQEDLALQIRVIMGHEASQAAELILKGAADRPDLRRLADWGGILTLMIAASVVFAELQSALNVIFETTAAEKQKASRWGHVREFISRRSLCLLMVVSFVLLTIISLAAGSVIKFYLTDDLEIWGSILHALLSFGVYALLFGGLFKFMPDTQVTWRSSMRGGVIAALFFVIGKAAIGRYLGETAIGSAYGAAGSLIALLVWVFYSSLAIYIGAEVSSIINRLQKA